MQILHKHFSQWEITFSPEALYDTGGMSVSDFMPIECHSATQTESDKHVAVCHLVISLTWDVLRRAIKEGQVI